MSDELFKLGITGGIGSGKSSVCRVFGVLGIPVFYADAEAKSIMDNDAGIMSEINSLTGRDMYHEGILDRRRLASLIFNDQKLLYEVNSLVHPVVFRNFAIWADSQSAPYVIMEAAILFESGGYKLVDKIATIVAPVEERIGRVMKSNMLTRNQVLERIRNQMDDEERIKQSDYIIRNAENDMIIPAILEIHREILNNIGKMNS